MISNVLKYMKNKNRKRSVCSFPKRTWGLIFWILISFPLFISQGERIFRLIRNPSRLATVLSSQCWMGARWKQYVETFLCECLTFNRAFIKAENLGIERKYVNFFYFFFGFGLLFLSLLALEGIRICWANIHSPNSTYPL